MLRLSVALPLLLAALPARAGDRSSFVNDVVPVLTRQGCNQGACHGKGAGQNGFRLSLRGYAPEQDHRSLTREFDARRIDPAFPEQSLLLTKPTGQVPHEGGKLFAVGSREYDTLLAWITAGAPEPDPADPKVTRLEVVPGDRVLKVGDAVQLTAWATFADGSRRDVTWLTRFDSNDAAVAGVTPAGLVTARRNGATAVRASFQTEVAVATFAVLFDRPVDEKLYAAGNNFIDAHVFAKLKALRIDPSGLSPEEEFVRRAYLDTCGILPTPDEVREFLADRSPDKRARLIDKLLDRPEFVDYWSLFLSDLLQNRKERDHDVRGTKGVRQFHDWLRKQVAANRPWDELARDVLTAAGSTTDSPAVGYFVVTVGEYREQEKSEVAESVAQAFLGTRIGCARCHNHPLERYTQDDFYHFAAFFARVQLDRKDPKQAPTVLRIAPRDSSQRGRPVGVTQPRTGVYLLPQPLDRSAVGLLPGEDPRRKLAAWVTDPANEFFAGAMVNRVWQHYLGVGLVEPVDDLRATNPPTNPALWAALKAEFVSHGYDLRHLMRVILNSRTYQLTSATRPGNESDSRFYSHYYARRLPAEVLLDAICQATGVPEKFDGYPEGVRAVQVPDPGVNSYFLRMFGRPERVTACACERAGDVTMPQLLNLQNGHLLADKAAARGAALPRLLEAEKDDDRVTEELFLWTLSRPPTADERRAVKAALAADARGPVFADLLWALLNSKSFAFNH
jgi:hypothetical protein